MKKFLSLLVCLLLTACNTEKEVLDDITMVRSFGFDKYPKKNHINGTIIYPIYIDEQTFKMRDLSAAGETAKEVRAELNEMVSKPLFVGKLNTVLFSQEIAKEGIMETLDMLQRDPGVGRAIYLAITKESTKEILTIDNNLANHDGNFYSSLIKQNENYSNLPHLNFHTFLYAYFSDCMDPILPYLSHRNNSVKIKGLALFKKDKMVGTLGEEDLLAFKTLYQNLNEGSYQFSSQKYKGNLEILKSRIHYTILAKPHHRVILNVNVKGRLTEYTKVNAGKPNVIKGIERNIEKELNREGYKLIGKFQKLNIDPIGIGEHVRSRTRAFDHKGWNKNYSGLDIKVKYQVKITESGISQ